MTTTPDRYVVMGNPIAHSKSPRIHALFAQQTGQAVHYAAMLVPLDGFVAAVTQFHHDGGKGANVTVPFKQEAFACAHELSPRAARAQAVNTLVLRADGTRYGDNTDGVGLVRDLIDNHGVIVRGRRVLLLGAGGASRGVLAPLLDAQPAELFIANRTRDKALELIRESADLGTVAGGGFDELQHRHYDIVINGTAASLHGELPPLPDTLLASNADCYDMMYGRDATPFMRWAQQHGARAFDGLGMLVEQAAEAFYVWRSVMPKTADVITTLRRELQG